MSRNRAKYYVPRTSTRIEQDSDVEQSCRNSSVVNINSNRNLPRTSTRIYRQSDFPLSDSVHSNRESAIYRSFRRENNFPAEQREASNREGSEIFHSFPTLPHRRASNSAENRTYESSNFRRNENISEEERVHPNSSECRIYAQNLPKTSTRIYRHSDFPLSNSVHSNRESTMNRSSRRERNFPADGRENSNCEGSVIYHPFPNLPHRRATNSAENRIYESSHFRHNRNLSEEEREYPSSPDSRIYAQNLPKTSTRIYRHSDLPLSDSVHSKRESTMNRAFQRNEYISEEERDVGNFSVEQRHGSSTPDDAINRSVPVRREENFSKQQREDLNFYPYTFDRDPVTNVLYEMKTDNIDNVYGFRKRASQALIFDHVIAVLMIQFVKSSEYPQPKHYREYEVCLQFLQSIRRVAKRYIPAIMELINYHEVKLFELYCQMEVSDIELDKNNRKILEDPVPQSITIEDMLNPNRTVHNCYVNTTAEENRLLLQQINTPPKKQNKSTAPMNEFQPNQQKIFIPTGHSTREDLDFSVHSNEAEYNLLDHSIDVELNPSANSTLIGGEAKAHENEPRLSQPDNLMTIFGTFGTILSNWQNQIVSRMEEDKRQIETMAQLISSFTKDHK